MAGLSSVSISICYPYVGAPVQKNDPVRKRLDEWQKIWYSTPNFLFMTKFFSLYGDTSISAGAPIGEQRLSDDNY